VTGTELLSAIVHELGEFNAHMVFTGGLVLPLYLERTPTYRIRPTDDADAVVACTTYIAWARFQEELGRVGIHPVSDDPDAPICRMRTAHGHLIDVMPMEPDVLGFGNRR
jgi:hypothetical protein